jgi:replicative DNA helicase
MNVESMSSFSPEEAVLGTFLVHSYEAWNYAKDLQPYMFNNTSNGAIFGAIQSCITQGMEPTTLAIYGILEDKSHLTMAGGQPYLAALESMHQPPKNLPDLIIRVQNNYKIRKLKQINQTIPELLDENPYKINEVISRLHKSLDDLVSEIGNPDVTKLEDSLDETIAKILERRKNPGIRGISTGMQEVDFMTSGFNSGDVWYIGARPSHGKSAWLIKTSLEVAKEGNAIMLFNREMGRDDINERIISIVSQVPLQDIRLGKIEEGQLNALKKATEIAKRLPIYVDNNFTSGADYIVATIRKYHQLYNIKVVGIDYIQLVVERSAESTHLLGAASRQLKLLAQELGITVIILSQLNRNVEHRDDRRPFMADLRQSGNLEEDADIMVALYRDEMYNDGSPDSGKLEFIVRKSRNGPTGTIVLRFDPETVNITHNKLDSWDEESFA